LAIVLQLLSLIILALVVFLGYKTTRAFRQSKQAVTESASILEVIVGALTSRIEASESVVADVGAKFDRLGEQTVELQSEQNNLRGSYEHVLGYVHEIMSNDRKLILELEQLKTQLTGLYDKETSSQKVQHHARRTEFPALTKEALGTLTPTERHVIEILSREGPKPAPELGRRMRKSREHMARLMKKLYLEGYVDRESNRAPFRYRLNNRIEPVVKGSLDAATVEAPEKP
jgi:DNA-binding MarR family transcriptional regulator